LEALKTDSETLGENITNNHYKSLKNLQNEQSYLQEQIQKSVDQLVKRREDATARVEAAMKEKEKAVQKVQTLLSSVAQGAKAKINGEKSTSTMKILKKISGVIEKNEKQATDQSKKLFKRLQECEAEVDEANRSLKSATDSIHTSIPNFTRDLQVMDESRHSRIKNLLRNLIETYLTQQETSINALKRLKSDIDNQGSLIEKAENDVSKNSGSTLDMQSESIHALAAIQPSSLSKETLERLKDSAKSNVKAETAVWFNAFVGRIYRDASCSSKFLHDYEKLIASKLNKAKKPKYIGNFTVSNLSLGQIPPIIRNAKWVLPGELQGADLEHDAAADLDVVYRSNNGNAIELKINTDIWLNWPREKGTCIPVKLSLKLVELTGSVRLGVRKGKSFCCFMRNPHTKFDVKSSIGNSAYLKNAPIVERAIVRIVKDVIAKKFVWPRVMKFKLLWPKAWWPDYRGLENFPESWGKTTDEWKLEKKENEKEAEQQQRVLGDREEGATDASTGTGTGTGGAIIGAVDVASDIVADIEETKKLLENRKQSYFNDDEEDSDDEEDDRDDDSVPSDDTEESDSDSESETDSIYEDLELEPPPGLPETPPIAITTHDNNKPCYTPRPPSSPPPR